MSKYTTTLKEIGESFLTHDELYADLPVTEIITRVKDKIFNFEYEWYGDGDSKNIFERDFLLRYWNEYIGFETLGMWKTYFIAKMNISMPYYSKLYAAVMEGDSPFITHDMNYNTGENTVTSSDGYFNSTENRSASNKTDTQGINSDNPQVTVNTNDYASGMSRAEEVTSGNSETESTQRNNDSSSSQKGVKTHAYGLQGKSRAELIDKYRQQIVNINREIIENCRTLFLGVW